MRFRKTLNLGPLRLNITKSGVSTSFGKKNARIGYSSKRGLYSSYSIPKTGIYDVKYLKNKKGTSLLSLIVFVIVVLVILYFSNEDTLKPILNATLDTFKTLSNIIK